MRLEKIPDELQTIDRWRLYDKDKRPLNAMGVVDRRSESLLSFSEAVHAHMARPESCGLAIELGSPNLCGIDLDGCVGPDGVEPWAKEIIERFDSYSELSPSGTGVHILFWDERANTYEQPWTRLSLPEWRGVEGKAAGLEVYMGGTRYLCTTGNRLRGPRTLSNAREAVDWLWSRFERKNAPEAATEPLRWYCRSYDQQLERAEQYISRIPGAQQGDRDQMLWRVAVVCWRFGLSQDDMARIMREWNQRCDPPEPAIDSRIRHKIRQVAKCQYQRGDMASEQWMDDDRITEILDRDEASQVYVRESDMRGPAVIEKLQSGYFDLQTTGIHALDKELDGGMPKHGVVAVMGRPSHGKTSLILHCLRRHAELGKKCLFVSFEMSTDELLSRRIAMVEKSPRTEWASKAESIAAKLENLPGSSNMLYVDSCRSLDGLEKCIRHAAMAEEVSVVAVDYLQKVPIPKVETEYQQVTKASERLTNLGRELRLTMYLAVQMNRSKEASQRGRPLMADARGSGQIEQDVDLMIHCHWPYKDDDSLDPSDYEIEVVKSRFMTPLHPKLIISWDHTTQTFEAPVVCATDEWQPKHNYQELYG